jgi:hypothetical protein
MSPEASSPATVEHVEQSTEAAVAAAAVTLEMLQTAIEAQAEMAQDRHDELTREVREWGTRLQTLATSIEHQQTVESPSLQQLLMQVGQMQTSLEVMQAELITLKGPSGEGHRGQAPERAGVKPEEQPKQKEPSEISPVGSETGKKISPQESSQSVTPAPKKRYVKI